MYYVDSIPKLKSHSDVFNKKTLIGCSLIFKWMLQTLVTATKATFIEDI